MVRASSKASHLRAADPSRAVEFVPPGPTYHHPVVALSLILSIASVVQVLVWFISQHLAVTPSELESTALIHGFLFYHFQKVVEGYFDDAARAQGYVLTACLLLGCVSCAAWYAVGRIALGPAWGLALGTTWAAYPAFAFLAQRIAPLPMLMALLPIVFAMTALWYRRKKRPEYALLIGLSLGALTLVLTITPLLLILLTCVMPTGGRSPRRRWTSTLLLWVGYVAVVLPLWTLYLKADDRRAFLLRVKADLTFRLDIGARGDLRSDLQAWTTSRPAEPPLKPAAFWRQELAESPGQVAFWFLRRFGRTLYATADGKLQRPLLALQLCVVLPAIWGAIVALRYRPWKWITLTGLLFLGVFWVSAALAEPFARNLVPIAGVLVLLALIGFADVYERTFGRRLIVRKNR